MGYDDKVVMVQGNTTCKTQNGIGENNAEVATRTGECTMKENEAGRWGVKVGANKQTLWSSVNINNIRFIQRNRKYEKDAQTVGQHLGAVLPPTS